MAIYRARALFDVRLFSSTSRRRWMQREPRPPAAAEPCADASPVVITAYDLLPLDLSQIDDIYIYTPHLLICYLQLSLLWSFDIEPSSTPPL